MTTRRRALQALAGGGLAAAFGTRSRAGAAPSVGGIVTGVAPTRILDTRTGKNYPFPKPQPTQRFVVVPQIFGCTALYLNVTVTDTEGPGFLTVWPGIGDPPDGSSINWWGPGQILSNMILCPVSAVGGFGVYVSPQSAVHVVIDVMGTITAA